MWINWNPNTLLVEMENGAVILENNLAVPQKVKYRVTCGPEIQEDQKYIYTQKLIYKCSYQNYSSGNNANNFQVMNKLNVVYSYNGILFGN